MSGPNGPEHVDFALTRVRDAVAALRTYAGNVGPNTAAEVLPYWAGYATLTEEQCKAVIDRFTVRP